MQKARVYWPQPAKHYNTRFIHISTDYVFNGQSPAPYTEEASTDPVKFVWSIQIKRGTVVSAKRSRSYYHQNGLGIFFIW